MALKLINPENCRTGYFVAVRRRIPKPSSGQRCFGEEQNFRFACTIFTPA